MISNIIIIYLRPCDAGIIKTFKTYYRSLYIEKVISKIENNNQEYKVTLLDALSFLSIAGKR
jgi:hypothetical protein